MSDNLHILIHNKEIVTLHVCVNYTRFYVFPERDNLQIFDYYFDILSRTEVEWAGFFYDDKKMYFKMFTVF